MHTWRFNPFKTTAEGAYVRLNDFRHASENRRVYALRELESGQVEVACDLGPDRVITVVTPNEAARMVTP